MLIDLAIEQIRRDGHRTAARLGHDRHGIEGRIVVDALHPDRTADIVERDQTDQHGKPDQDSPQSPTGSPNHTRLVRHGHWALR